ncbi:putative oxidoreductase/Short-chain dehydrogenase [Labilithrix luteola]|uniref:Putative oxidoreductase/Short-chain dehydrogenase n=1 Tax=Labilithrix luteola TaxID=1391654 RepID=A0A0K1PQ17_9BACT|nr:SDR family NAD(P)-dependent oxidoreductase [Labilithrix luteola]AKU95617.1 putative oxidoreductase/Short-chain dehydrogenase [Labilithrix luteola]
MRTFLVTGANSGLGATLTRMLAVRGHHVVMAVRDVNAGEETRASILRAAPEARLEVEPLDLLDIASVRALAAKVRDVDVLVNNAGVGLVRKALTPGGVVLPFATNHLGHFALTALLFDRLAQRDDARVVTVTSFIVKRDRIDLSSIDGSRYDQRGAYAQSKLANLLFGVELSRRSRAVKSILAHPGMVMTPLQRKPQGLMGIASRAFSALFARPVEYGAAALLEAAIGDSASGDLWGPGHAVGDPPLKETWRSMTDIEGAKALWRRSEELTGISFL